MKIITLNNVIKILVIKYYLLKFIKKYTHTHTHRFVLGVANFLLCM